jgi:hypothetical protein
MNKKWRLKLSKRGPMPALKYDEWEKEGSGRIKDCAIPG